MTTIAFDSFTQTHRARRPAFKRAAVVVSPVAAPTLPPAAVCAPLAPQPAARRLNISVLAAAVAALHVAAVAVLGGAAAPAARAPLPPISVALIAPPVEPPLPLSPPRAARPQLQPARAKAVAAAPRPAAPPSAPLVAGDTPLTSATPDTVQVAAVAASVPAPPAPAVPEKITEPRGYAGYLNNPPPAYPAAAQKRGLEGQVVLKVHVQASGQPDNVTVARSSGHAILDDAALKAVAQWTFEPARRGQSAIDGWVQVPLNFKI